MARYKVLEKSYIGNRLEEAGAEVDYDTEPGENLEPLDEAAHEAVAAKVAAAEAKEQARAEQRKLRDAILSHTADYGDLV